MQATPQRQVLRNRRIAGGLLAAAVVAGTAYAVPTAAATPPVAADPPPAAASDPAHHLSPRLALIASDGPTGSRPAGDSQLSLTTSGPGSLLRTPSGRLVVEVRLGSRDAAAIEAIEDAGATLLPQPPDYGRLAVSVLPQDLQALGDVAGVTYVGEELTPQVNAVCDSTRSAGDGILRADRLRTAGVDGAGVKVGVLSDSYDTATGALTHAAADIASDDLPGVSNTCGHTSASAVTELGRSGSDEGRAMMQVVHDLAPGSPLDFATGSTSEATFAANIIQLAAQGAKVIVDDVTYIDEPFYQDGIIEQAISAVRTQGVTYVSSAGNNRMVDQGFDIGSYEAANGYRPTTCPAIPEITAGHSDCHNFGSAGAPSPMMGFLYAAGQFMRPILQWAEPWDGGVHTDLDMYLVDISSNTVIGTASILDNLASQQAIESFGGTLGHNLNLALVVARRSNVAPSTTPRFKIIWATGGDRPFLSVSWRFPAAGTGDVIGPTVFGHNGGADVMTVGASDVRVTRDLDSYSSWGPVTTLFGPVNGATPAAPLATPRVVNKPDLVATDCNLTTFYSGDDHVFCGTSAAAPHAAAVAALLRQRFPAATTSAIDSALAATASPISGVPGSFQGGGLVNACAASAALGAGCPPAPPILTGTDPASPGASTTPAVRGIAEAGTTVTLFTTTTCSGAPAATGTAAAFTSTGLHATVAVGSTTTFHAVAANSGGSSACSPTSVVYTDASPTPNTTITKSPGKKVKTTKRKAKVSFAFASTIGGSTFACSIDGKAFAPCTSGATYQLKAGKHTFAVRATAGGVTDATPASVSFTVKKKRPGRHPA